MSFLISITGGLIALFFLLVFILVLSIISIFIGSNLTILFLFGVLIAYLYLKKQDKQSIVLKQKEEQGIQLKDKEEKVKHLENESKVLDSEPIKRLLKGFVSRIPTRIIIKESDTIDLKSHWEDDDVVIVHNILVGYADEFEDPNKFYDQADEFDELKEILVKKYSLDILNINDAILKKKLFVLFYQKLCHDIDKVIIPAQDENEAIERYLHIYDVSSKSGLP
ncbi:hypothetical protein J4450_07065, partial [Candidatus Micrarchaeota archaeon]|nr:hypothetical protein [Candidatus Micrarchaeota archaeon]